MKASVMLEHEEKYTVILAFDVKIERDAQEMADSLGVKIFQADIIYHLFDRFTAYQDDLKKAKRDQFKNIAVFPCKMRVLPNFVFNSRDPIVAGVIIEAGVVRQGTPICVPSKSVSFTNVFKAKETKKCRHMHRDDDDDDDFVEFCQF
jgi:translation initiation factor 5B